MIMKMLLISPFAQRDVTVAWIELNTPTGNLIILPGHAPTIISISPDTPLTYCLKNGKKETILVHRGMADIGRDVATIMVDSSL
jgi:F0F1-type ATP synthase epsilon subunit